MSGSSRVSRPDYLRLRSALYDRITGLPALPILFDDLREMLETRRVVGLLHASIPSLALAESVYGWQAFDRIVARMASEVGRLVGDLLPRTTRLAQPGVHGDGLIAIVPDGHGEGGLSRPRLAELARGTESALLAAFSTEEFATMVPRLEPRVGFAMLSENPFFRLERLVYRAVEEARAFPSQRAERVRRSWGDEMQRIIREEGIAIHYQPVVELETLEVIGYEALSRGPAGSGLESPRLMFQISREAGIGRELDRLCRRLALSSARGIHPGRKIFLNTGPDHLTDPEWKDQGIERSLALLDLRPGDLVVEVPHPGASTDDASLERVLGELKRRGFGLAIDDIGTGYAGIRSLERLSPDYLKIDISLVRGIDANLLQQDLLASLVSIGRRIGATVIAEGIESAAEMEFLRLHGARYGQGYLFSAAVPSLLPGPMVLARDPR